MTQDTQSSQTAEQTLDSNSSQPEVVIRDLDSPTPNKDVTPSTMIEGEAPVQEAQQSEASDDVRKLLEDQQKQIENLKKGLYDKGREAADLKRSMEPAAQAPEQNSEVAEAMATLTENGMATQQGTQAMIDSLKKEMSEAKELDGIVAANPSINRALLEDLAKANPEMAYADIVNKHKVTLLGDGTLQKAHSQRVMGEPIAKVEAPKLRPSEMNDADFAAFLNNNSTGSKYLTHGNKYF